MSEKFNFEEALKALQSGQVITGKDGVIAPLMGKLPHLFQIPRFSRCAQLIPRRFALPFSSSGAFVV